MKSINLDQLLGIVRHVLTIVGTVLAVSGSAIAGSWEVIVGSTLALATVVWSVWAKTK